MDEDKLNKLISKFELLYQINSNSPLFITIAYKKILDNDLDGSLSIIEKGLLEFPDHPTALLLKSRILIKNGNFSQALKLIKKASNLLGSPKTFDFYLTELETLNKQSIKIEVEDKTTNIQHDIISDLNNIREKLPELNTNKEHIEVKTNLQSDYSVIDDSLIISDTLAKIYFNQKEYKEAIRIYNKLKSKYPEKSDFYDSKISEIKSLLENS